MAVGDDKLGDLHPVPGFRLGTVSAGIKQPGRPDLVLMELSETANTAVVFTRNAFCAAPVSVAREHLEACEGRPRYLLVNTGNANAGTGQEGMSEVAASKTFPVIPWTSELYCKRTYRGRMRVGNQRPISNLRTMPVSD